MTGVSGLFQNTMGARIARGETTEWKERLKAEYRQLKDRCDRLDKFIAKYEEVDTECPLSVFEQQRKAMGEYLHCLEVRAQIEQIEL